MVGLTSGGLVLSLTVKKNQINGYYTIEIIHVMLASHIFSYSNLLSFYSSNKYIQY